MPQPMKWSGIFAPRQNTVRPVAGEGSDSDQLARERYLASLRSPAPSQWYSDHLREDQRLRGAVYVALKVLGDQAAAAEAKVYRWDEHARQDGNHDHKEPLPRSHPLCRLLNRPNKWESGGYLRRRRVHQMGLTGTSLLWRVDEVNDTRAERRPIEMWSVPTGTYQPVPPSATYPEGAYRILPWFPGPLAMIPGAWSAGGVVVPAGQMVRCMHPHPLVQWEGLSPLAACDLALDTIESIDRARFSKMRRSVNPSAKLKTDPAVQFPNEDGLTRLRRELQQLLGGPDLAGAVAILGPGQDLEPWGDDNVEVGWIDSWSQLISFCLSIYGITKSLAFMGEDASYAALYAGLKQFNLFTLCPLLDMLSEADNQQFVEPFWGPDYHVAYEPKKIDDEQLLEAKLANDLRAGIRLNSEMRALRELPPLNQPWEKERATFGGGAPQKPGAESGMLGDGGDFGKAEAEGRSNAVEKERPRNQQSQGSLPGRRLFTNGTNGNGKR